MSAGETIQQTEVRPLEWQVGEEQKDPFAESAMIARQQAEVHPLSARDIQHAQSYVEHMAQEAQMKEVPPGIAEEFARLRRYMPREDYKQGTPDIGVLSDKQILLYALHGTATADDIDAFVTYNGANLLVKPDPSNTDPRVLQRHAINNAFNTVVGISHLEYDPRTKTVK